jgi:ABC-type multidrug transport system permease subunit
MKIIKIVLAEIASAAVVSGLLLLVLALFFGVI